MRMELRLDINADSILADLEEDQADLARDIKDGVAKLAVQAHAHILEEAAHKLHARREAFVEAIGELKQIDDHTWAITVPPSAMWIEEGMDEHDMLPALLNGKNAKTAADGSRYAVIPFKHSDPQKSRGPSKSSAFAKQLTNMVRSEMKKRGIAYQRPIEKNGDGSPKLGLLHSFDVPNSPQRGATRLNAAWTSPALKGVRVYQKITKDENGKESVSRDVMTFRVASSKHAGQKWKHPGLKRMGFIDEAYGWATHEWIFNMLPSILKKYGIT